MYFGFQRRRIPVDQDSDPSEEKMMPDSDSEYELIDDEGSNFIVLGDCNESEH